MPVSEDNYPGVNPDDSNRVIGVYGDARIGTIDAKPIVTALTSS